MPRQTVTLAILDGWGLGRPDNSNPIHIAQPKNINYIKKHYPAGSLQASGIAVGLPWNEEGSSEVGHLILGAGKIIYQHFPRISLAIKDGSFFKNQPLLDAFAHAKKNNSSVHFIGLLGESNIHSSLDHIEALLKLAAEENFSKIYLHFLTDGRDSAPKAALKLIPKLPRDKIASLSGRYFAMDRDLHWDRTERSYNAILGKGSKINGNLSDFLNSFYDRGLTDEFIEPTVVREEGRVKEGDSIIFFNFREDSMRQLTEMFINPSAGSTNSLQAGAAHEIPSNLYIVTFTRYSNTFNLPAAFPSEEITNPLGKVLSSQNKVQLRIAETEKYAHVTYFFNGLREQAFKNEYRVLIPSKSLARPDESPEMMAGEITARVTSALSEGVYDFILVNYANPDVIAHTGNLDAGVKAVKAIDQAVGLLLQATLEHNHVLIITADHGNIEQMINPRTGERETKHDPNQVPVYLIREDLKRDKSEATIKSIENSNTGVLSDIAPTILELMHLTPPPEMTGMSLIKLLQ